MTFVVPNDLLERLDRWAEIQRGTSPITLSRPECMRWIIDQYLRAAETKTAKPEEAKSARRGKKR